MSISSETELADKAIEDGRRLVAALDEDGVVPTVAFWYYSTTHERWRLVIASLQADTDTLQQCY